LPTCFINLHNSDTPDVAKQRYVLQCSNRDIKNANCDVQIGAFLPYIKGVSGSFSAMRKLHIRCAIPSLAGNSNSAYLDIRTLKNSAQHKQKRRTAPMATFNSTRTTYDIASFTNRAIAFVAEMAHAASAWNDARITNKALSKLTDRELTDIGLSRGDIEDVARSNFIR
jgi:uncharacterized protein YjiS (DUF1127 family)